jgi:5-methyltetrahydrofolate--homocysteine methyltransferase
MIPIPDRIKKGDILVSDGAMGSLLFQKGLKSGECPESLNLSKPEVLEEVAQAYLDAGANIIQTNTFGASPMKLAEYGLENKTGEINKAAVSIVSKVVGKQAYVSGSCGPTGKILKPFGEAEPEAIFTGFERQLDAIISAGIDVICIETMTDLNEAKLALKAAKRLSPTTPVMVTLTFQATPKGFYTIMGNSISDAASTLENDGADIIGSNCGNGLEIMIQIAWEFKKITNLPLLIQANAGLPFYENGVLTYPETPEFFAQKTPELIDMGVSIIGGCCGTTPDTIRAIRRIVDSR